MNSEVQAVLNSLGYGRHLKDLYDIGLSPRTKLKSLTEFIRNIQIDYLCLYVKRFIFSKPHCEVAPRREYKLQIKCYNASCYMFFGIIHIFKYKADEVLDELKQSIGEGFIRWRHVTGPRHLYSAERDALFSAMSDEMDTEGSSSDLHLLESSASMNLFQMLQESGNTVNDIRSITMIEEDDQIRGTPVGSELNIEFLQEFCGGDAQAIQQLQASWSSRGPQRLISEENPLTAPDSLECDAASVSVMPVELPSNEDMIGSFLQSCYESLYSTDEFSYEGLRGRRSSTLFKENSSLVISATVIGNRMKNPLWKAYAKGANLAIHELPELEATDPLSLLMDATPFIEHYKELHGSEESYNFTSMLRLERDTSVPLSLAARVHLNEERLQNLHETARQHLQQTRAVTAVRFSLGDSEPTPCKQPRILLQQFPQIHSSPPSNLPHHIGEVNIENDVEMPHTTTDVSIPHTSDILIPITTDISLVTTDHLLVPTAAQQCPDMSEGMQLREHTKNFEGLQVIQRKKRRRRGQPKTAGQLLSEIDLPMNEADVGMVHEVEHQVRVAEMPINIMALTEETLLDHLKSLSLENHDIVKFSQLCNPNMSRIEVAHIFSLLLNLAGKYLIEINQTTPFDPDCVFIRIPVPTDSVGHYKDLPSKNM